MAFAAVLCVLALAGPAAAAGDCGTAVIRDWRDGRIDGTYAPRCYRSALQELPEDLRVYSSAESDITRALTDRLARRVRSLQQVPSSSTTRGSADRRATPSALASDTVVQPSGLPIPVLVAAVGAIALVAAAAVSVVARRLRRALATRH